MLDKYNKSARIAKIGRKLRNAAEALSKTPKGKRIISIRAGQQTKAQLQEGRRVGLDRKEVIKTLRGLTLRIARLYSREIRCVVAYISFCL